MKSDLPQFSKFEIANVLHDLAQILDENNHLLEKMLSENKEFSWANLLVPMELMDNKLHNYWSIVSHLHGVTSSDLLRKAYHESLPKLTEYSTNIHHNKKLFDAIQYIANNEYEHLDEGQKKVIDNDLRDFKLAGVHLEDQAKKQYAKITEELAQLAAKFEENLLDATHGWNKLITDKKELAGLSDYDLALAKSAAEAQNKEGWLFTLDMPSYLSIMKFADSRPLRQEMYFAYNTRASDQGPQAGKWDNSGIMFNIMSHRQELAKLLSFNNFAELSLATKMAKQPHDVIEFIQELTKAGIARAKMEFQELVNFSHTLGHEGTLEAWDVPYYSEKLRKYRYDLSQEDLRPYFPETKVLPGLFIILKKLYGITITKVENADVWHPDVKCFQINDAHGHLISYFYIDLYARENKRGGAWMDECRVHWKLPNDVMQIPVAFIDCNFNPPVGDKPALFTHEDVVTLFHEFGHALQHMLTKVNYSPVSGIAGIPWDAVELPSQFFEHWAWDKESLALIAENIDTKQPLPPELFEKMHRARNFQSAMQMMRQLEFALFDFRLHLEFDPAIPNQIQTILDEVRSELSVFPSPKFNRFQNAFSHIFAGGYAAGYYSYKWAEVMADDAFSLFKEKGIFDCETSKKFLETFLESGGTKNPLDLFIEFRGRKPCVDALLQQNGIID